jgi:hypothetical protein
MVRKSAFSPAKKVVVKENSAPTKPTLSGPSSGKLGALLPQLRLKIPKLFTKAICG